MMEDPEEEQSELDAGDAAFTTEYRVPPNPEPRKE